MLFNMVSLSQALLLLLLGRLLPLAQSFSPRVAWAASLRLRVATAKAATSGGWDDSELGAPLNTQRSARVRQEKGTAVAATTTTAVFVGNLPLSFTMEQLEAFAALHGATQGLSGARIQMDFKKVRSRGFGFLDFARQEDAEVAVAKLQGLQVEGRALKLDVDSGVAGPNRGRRIDPTSRDFAVFVGNLDYSLREKDVEEIFRREILKDAAAGADVEDEAEGAEEADKFPIRCRIHSLEGRSKGYGHVHFADAEAQNNALFLNGFEVMGRALIVEKVRATASGEERVPATAAAGAAGDRPVTPSIFVGNLAFDVTANDVFEMCEDVLGKGVVKKIRLSVDRETGDFRGFGHLDFATEQDASRALSELGDVELFGRRLRVDKAVRSSAPSSFGGPPPGRSRTAGGRGRDFKERSPRGSGRK
jgi:RNA recognition motif-containing protein